MQIKEILKKYIKRKIPLTSRYYNLDLNKNYHIFKAEKNHILKKIYQSYHLMNFAYYLKPIKQLYMKI